MLIENETNKQINIQKVPCNESVKLTNFYFVINGFMEILIKCI
jgi:hypothetical protein